MQRARMKYLVIAAILLKLWVRRLFSYSFFSRNKTVIVLRLVIKRVLIPHHGSLRVLTNAGAVKHRLAVQPTIGKMVHLVL